MPGEPMSEMSNWNRLLSLGLQGEALVREWYKRQGYFVLPVSLINNGGAPALEGYVRKVIVANHLAFKGADQRWVEVKTYARASFNQQRHRWEHGVPQRLWLHYLEGQALTHIPGYLTILQVNKRLIMEGRIDRIATTAYVQAPAENHPPSGLQIFFDTRFFDWYRLDTLEPLPKMDSPKVIREWEEKPFPSDRQPPLF